MLKLKGGGTSCLIKQKTEHFQEETTTTDLLQSFLCFTVNLGLKYTKTLK